MKTIALQPLNATEYEQWLRTGTLVDMELLSPSTRDTLRVLHVYVCDSNQPNLRKDDAPTLKALFCMLHYCIHGTDAVPLTWYAVCTKHTALPNGPLPCSCRKSSLFTAVYCWRENLTVLKSVYCALQVAYLMGRQRPNPKRCSRWKPTVLEDAIVAGGNRVAEEAMERTKLVDYRCRNCVVSLSTRVCHSGHLLCYACGTPLSIRCPLCCDSIVRLFQ